MQECAALYKIEPGMDPRTIIIDDRTAYNACRLQNQLKKECITHHNVEAAKSKRD
jgi:hypothetical protein